MKKMFLLFSHKLTSKQVADAQRQFAVNEFVYLPKDLQNIWSDISPDLKILTDLLEPIKQFLNENVAKNDVILIQGDFGAVYIMVNFCKSLGLKTVYATTKRMVSEFKNDNGQCVKKSIFEHRRFREYGR